MDISQLQTNVNGKGRQNSGKKNKELVKREQIEGTPFEIITTNKKHFIGMGSYRMTSEVENKEELIKMIQDKEWSLIIQTISAVWDAMNRKDNK